MLRWAQAWGEPAEILVEQDRIDRHVDERVHPRQPAVLKGPEPSEGAVDPPIVAAFEGEHARELADDEDFGNGPEDGNEEEGEQRHPGAAGGAERLGGDGAAGRADVPEED